MGNTLNRIHGLQSPRFLIRSRASAAADETVVFGVNDTNGMGEEAYSPFTVVALFDSHRLAGQAGRDVDFAAVPFDRTVRAHSPDRCLGRIVRLWQHLRHRPVGGA